MPTKIPKTLKELELFLTQGEGSSLEFKRSTGELREGLQTACAFLNGEGGLVIFGVRPDGRLEGQQVTDQTLREIVQGMDRFEPSAKLPMRRIKVKRGLEAVLLEVPIVRGKAPFTYDGRVFERIESVTKRMSQVRYETLLVNRAHGQHRWESAPAPGVKIADLDGQEILRVRDLAIQQNRISPGTGRSKGEILDRMGLLINGVPTQAAQVLFGRPTVSDYPQCLLKLGRFRGTRVTGEIVDNRQDYYNAFAAVRETMAFLERTLPLGARFPKGTVFREDRFPVPMEALREIVLNAVMHRDYSNFSGYVAVAVFDDHIEISSLGTLPSGITVQQLSRVHTSQRRNPLIAEAFHRTGAVEVWGRGTNRVIEACKKQGSPEPVFEERSGFLVVRFEFSDAAPGTEKGLAATTQVTAQVAVQVTAQVADILKAAVQPRSREDLQAAVGIKHREHFRVSYLKPLVEAGLLVPTIPDKPNSRLQRYILTGAGVKELKKWA